MAKQLGDYKRKDLQWFEGVNNSVSSHLASPNELRYAENVRSKTIGTIEKREGYRRLGSIAPVATANYGIFNFPNTTGKSFYRVSTIAGPTTSIYYLANDDNWTALTGGGTGLTAVQCSTTIAEGICFFVNGTDANRYIAANGTTVTTSSTAAGHLYNSPVANKIKYFKEKLYLADYTVGSKRYKNGIMFSSVPLGIVSLVDGDHDSGVTTVNVTDTKYIQSSDTIQVYRSGSLITTLTVTAKTQSTLTVNATGAALLSADELWVNGTYSAQRIFRWVENPQSGVDVKLYDTFAISGDPDNQINMLEDIGNYLIIGNNNSFALWNGINLQEFNLGVGCVSTNGYVKNSGSLFFVHYNGIYETTGGMPKLISEKVNEYFSGATKAGLEASAAGKKGKSVFFSIGTVTLYNVDGSTKKTLSNVVLEFDMRKQNWYVHTGIAAKQFATYISSSDPDRLEFMNSSDFKIYEFLKERDDNKSEIPCNAETNDLYLSSKFEKFFYPRYLILQLEAGNTVHVLVSLDGKPFFELKETASKGCTIIKITPRSEDEKESRCRRIAIALRETSKGVCKAARLSVLYEDADEEVLHSA